MNTFSFDEIELKSIKSFRYEHKPCIEEHLGKFYMDTYFQYIFTETSLGLTKVIKCPYCNSQEDVTNVESW